MKKLLLISSILCSFVLTAQVTSGQVDDFQDGTKQGWSDVGAASAFADNISDGGPEGAEDAYLRNVTTGNPGGPGSRMIIKNTSQWTGDFTTAGVQSIILDVRALNVDVTVRVSMQGAGGKISSTTGVVVTAGSGWTEVTIPITAANMQTVSDGSDGGPAGTDVVATLAAVTEFRILSNPIASWVGEVTNAEMHFDNIIASAVLSTKDLDTQKNEFVISPNPAKNSLNIKLSEANTDAKLEVFDVLGKRIYNASIMHLNPSIDVSNWKSGIYLVKISNDNTTQTKRFIKQ